MTLRYASVAAALCATLALAGCGGPAATKPASAAQQPGAQGTSSGGGSGQTAPSGEVANLITTDPSSTDPSVNGQLADVSGWTKPEVHKVPDSELVAYDGPIGVMFSHQLIAWPQKALKAPNRVAIDTDLLTVAEFKRLLRQLYDNNWVLVDPNTVFKVENGKVVKAKLMLPKGKKPLLYSVDDVRYDHRVQGEGSIDKIIVDKQGRIATWTSAKNSDTGKDEISYDNDIYPIVDAFVAQHPDFSFNGAKVILGMTGYVSEMGYRTARLQGAVRPAEIARAKIVAGRLKELGYTFASHGYAHLHSAHVTDAKLKSDSQKWVDEVQNIVGKTAVYIWPFGESDPYKSAKRQSLIDDFGFRMFLPVGSDRAVIWEGKSVTMDRTSMDGLSLRHFRKTDAKNFGIDTAAIYESDYRGRLNPQAGGVK